MTEDRDWDQGIPEKVKEFCDSYINKSPYDYYKLIGNYKTYKVIAFCTKEIKCIGLPTLLVFNNNEQKILKGLDAIEYLQETIKNGK